ncbi:MAG TPA: aminotransferase class I/II-fold pyridoxal phosphate-dependent enzyme [Woeseiaceae bacterium]|nr:aminotransferase class I/II-fold pyridoxal phosphate-dependent enzyme [Woeseiaceae bacterium]
MLDPREIRILQEALKTLSRGFDSLPEHPQDGDMTAIAAVLQDVAARMQDNFPYHHPRYAGQMLKPPHPVARLAYALSLWLNPNNHALDGGRASSTMEKECVAELARMFGFAESLGHLCGGGTMANLEALWVAGRLAPGRAIAASAQAHYTHARISDVLQLEFESVAVTPDGRMDIAVLEALLEKDNVGTVVATLGTTGLGAVDPLPEILELRDKHGFRVHVDAAYGGYFKLASETDEHVSDAFARVAEADSIVVDPHKHGLQPYGCGCVLFRDPAVGALYRHDSPYTYFSSAELHLGEISLECSRPGAAAVALWATQRLLPLVRGGEFAAGLDRSLRAARKLWCRVAESSRYFTLAPPELDIVVFGAAAADAQSASARARDVFARAAGEQLYLALVDLPAGMVAPYRPEMHMNQPRITCLRSCLMKPEHDAAIDDIWRILDG